MLRYSVSCPSSQLVRVVKSDILGDNALAGFTAGRRPSAAGQAPQAKPAAGVTTFSHGTFFLGALALV